MRKLITNSTGASLAELMVGLGISALVAVGGMQMMKTMDQDKANFSAKMDGMSASKLIEGALISPNGCSEIIGKELGSEVSVLLGGKKELKSGVVFGGFTISSLKFANFIPVDITGLSGIGEISLSLTSPKSARPIQTKIILSMNVIKSASNQITVESCNQVKQQSINNIVDKLCQGTYGTTTSDFTCMQVVQFLQRITARSICKDLYGSNSSAQYNGVFCDLSGIHKDQKCPTGTVLNGFDDKGQIVCKQIPDPTAIPCQAWSSFEPAESTFCPSQQVSQTRRCLTSGMTSLKETRVRAGTSVTDCSDKNSCRPPGSWSVEGVRCTIDDPNESYMTDSTSTVTASGSFQNPPDEKGISTQNSGSVTFRCVDSEPVITTQDCKAPTPPGN